MAMLSESDASEVRKIFDTLSKDVNVRVYTRKLDCPACQDTETILKELDELSKKLKVQVLNPMTDTEKAEQDGVENVPAIIVSDGEHSRVRFYGTPSGYEFSSLLTAIVDTGGSEEPLADETRAFLDGLETDLEINVFVTPSCPHCPSAAVLASRMARYSPRVRSCVIEANEFQQLSAKYGVQGVPRTVINDKLYAEGALPENMMVKALEKGLEEAPESQKNLMDYVQT